ncbi:MAG TPA: hypothetical protein VG406_17525 [Isosphaeraceae bacterium]|jgi:hypothetical protein|nr:hypothetical protein [Isosphaeraceae bacterium]
MMNMTEVVIDLPGVSETAFEAVGELIEKALARPRVKNRDAIKDAFLVAVKTCPTANASDLWHHVVYRQYLQVLNRHRPQNPDQSWKRSSGEALELAVEEIYEAVLAENNVRIQMLIGKPKKLAALKAMGIDGVVGSDKLDVALYLDDTDEIFGGVHVKASLAERISDDVPCSREMMAKGFFSPLWTLDVKSFPPPHPEPLLNRGELGSTNKPSEKRKYVELHGNFDHLFSANARSVPSADMTISGKRVFTIDLSSQPDLFAKEVIARSKRFRESKSAAYPPTHP